MGNILTMKFIDAKTLEESTNFVDLIEALKTGFQSNITCPMRHHHDYENPAVGINSTLLLMPAWQSGENLGVKVVTVSPQNGQYGLPAIQGIYLLFDGLTGQPKLFLEGKTLTTKRTAAASALASSFLSNKNSRTLLMVGTGALAPNLIEAHCTQRPIEQVWIWGRNPDKAQALALEINNKGIQCSAVDSLEAYIPQADIISCATLSPTPLILGKWLRPGQHIDLVGSYKKDTREADDNVIQKASIFVDTFQGGLKESGDILIPLQSQILKREEVLADLFTLCQRKHPGRTSREQITVFKSVGHALEDLVAANYFHQKIEKRV